MKDKIHAIVMGLSSTVKFYFGPHWEANLLAEDESNDIIAVLLPYMVDGQEGQYTGRIATLHKLQILLLKKSNIDDSFDTRESTQLSPMESLACELYLKIKRYFGEEVNPNPINLLSRFQLFTEYNVYDTNFDGYLLELEIPQNLDISYCQNNYTFTISSDGAAVTNDITWLHTISQVSSDGVTFNATANLSGTGYTFDVSAGSSTTGSYTFTPTTESKTVTHKVWVKWDNDLITPMYFKVDYTYTG